MNTILKVTTLAALVALAACSPDADNEAAVVEPTEVVEPVVEATEAEATEAEATEAEATEAEATPAPAA
jgi:hypothetical protein